MPQSCQGQQSRQHTPNASPDITRPDSQKCKTCKTGNNVNPHRAGSGSTLTGNPDGHLVMECAQPDKKANAQRLVEPRCVSGFTAGLWHSRSRMCLHQPGPAGTDAHSLPSMARPAVGPRQHFSCLSRGQGTVPRKQPRKKAANQGIEIPFKLCLSAPHRYLQVSSGPPSIIQTPMPTPADSTWR